MVLFNRDLLVLNNKRFASKHVNHNFLYVEVANRICENLQLLGRKFNKSLEIAGKDDYLYGKMPGSSKENAENEENLNFADESFDLVVSNLNFHFINEIPEFLLKIKDILKKEGIFIASFFGEENLKELRHVLYEVENEIYGGVSGRVAPTIDVKTAANLMQKAGFSNPISDIEYIKVEYSNVMKLFEDLKFMGQGNILNKRSKKFMTKSFLSKICDKYIELYGNENGEVSASFGIVTIMGKK